MENLRQQYNELSNKTATEFSKLLKEGNGKIIFYQNNEEDEELLTQYYFEGETMYEFRNDITGSCYDAYILSVSNEGILIAETEDTDIRHTLKFSDLANLQDKISLVEEMRILLNN